MKKDVYCVILAGGQGERLWPLSTPEKPKQLLSIVGQKTLLDQTYERACLIASPEHIFLSTTAQYSALLASFIARTGISLLIEPEARNTGPAILSSCYELSQKDPNALLIFLSADAFIPEKDVPSFAQYVEHAVDFARQTPAIVLLGATPTYPATGYGYIEYRKTGSAPYAIKKFHEKPSLEKAQEYCASVVMLWNTGIFCAQAAVFIQAFERYAPDLYQNFMAYQKTEVLYSSIPALSIDYAVLEKNNEQYVLPMTINWSDVGNLETFLSLKQQSHSSKTHVISIDAQNNLIETNHKLIALIGVHDLCIVHVNDTLLIAKRTEVEKVRAVASTLKEREI